MEKLEQRQKQEDLIPEEIELDGSTLNLSGYEEVEGDAPKETKTVVKTETEETDDLLLIYKDEIKAFLDKYLALIAGAVALFIIGITAIKKYRSWYDLWWQEACDGKRSYIYCRKRP